MSVEIIDSFQNIVCNSDGNEGVEGGSDFGNATVNGTDGASNQSSSWVSDGYHGIDSGWGNSKPQRQSQHIHRAQSDMKKRGRHAKH
jgi:hypothetical protein